MIHSPLQSSVSTDWAIRFSAVSNFVLLYKFLQNLDLIFKGATYTRERLIHEYKCNERNFKISKHSKKQSVKMLSFCCSSLLPDFADFGSINQI